jgi:TatD DNase family protein
LKLTPDTQHLEHAHVDSHAHLDDAAFDADREQVIERARAAGLAYLLTVGGGTGVENLGRAAVIAARYDWIYASAGIHPHDAAQAGGHHFQALRALLHNPKVVAVGEIGLDYFYDHSPRAVQQQVLIQQLALAREFHRPVIIHCRDAFTDLRRIVADHWQGSPAGGILHCFSGTRDDAFYFLDRGFLISFAGNVTFKKADDLRAVAREIPPDRLLSETDCPYLAPVPHRGKRNEPAFVGEVTQVLATLHQQSEEEMGRSMIGNFETVFHLNR